MRLTGRTGDYGKAFQDLLRFVRNMHEHPPPKAMLQAALGSDLASSSAKQPHQRTKKKTAAWGNTAGSRAAPSSSGANHEQQALVADYLIRTVPELPLAVFLCLESSSD